MQLFGLCTMRERVEMRVWEQRDARRCPTEYRNRQAEPLLHELVPASRRVFRFEEVLAEQACDNWLVFVVNL